MEQLKTIDRELAMGSHGGDQSMEFLDLVKSIYEARSKADEDRIVRREIDNLKRRIADLDVPRRRMKEYIIRLVYLEMLSRDTSFGYIHAVKMTHDDALPLKRTGYLVVTIFLIEDHNLIILIVNTIQKDLRSDNYLVVCAALTAVCRIINEDTIPAVLPQVVDLLVHPKEPVGNKNGSKTDVGSKGIDDDAESHNAGSEIGDESSTELGDSDGLVSAIPEGNVNVSAGEGESRVPLWLKLSLEL